MNSIKEYLSEITASSAWTIFMLIGGLATSLISFVGVIIIAPEYSILALLVGFVIGTVMTVLTYWKNMFIVVDPEVVKISYDMISGKPEFHFPGMGIVHPLRPVSDEEEISLRKFNININGVSIECSDVRLTTDITVSLFVDKAKIDMFYHLSDTEKGRHEYVERIFRQKISNMLFIAKRWTAEEILNKKQEDLIEMMQEAFNDEADPTEPEAIRLRNSAIKTEEQTGVQLDRIDFGDMDYKDQRIIDALNNKRAAKLLKKTAKTLKGVDKELLELALIQARNPGITKKIVSLEGDAAGLVNLLGKLLGKS